ncbi:MAG: EAL domain-containing protein [Alphaproteobacteria bacterium]|nr:EAL domain-containing protein [Alphaproteobacteria bacterium]
MLKPNRHVGVGAKALTEEIKLLSGLLNQSHDAVVAFNEAKSIVFVNDMAVSMFGCHAEDDLLNHPIRSFLPEENLWYFNAEKEVSGNELTREVHYPHLSQVDARRADGLHFKVYVRIGTHLVNGELTHFLFLRDQTIHHDLITGVDPSIYYDQLTGLPKREALLRSLDTVFESYVSQGRRFLMMEIGIDQMRAINSTFGMEDGNTIIRLVGDRLAKAMMKWEFFGRGSGDRFSVLFEIPKGSSANSSALEVQKVITDAFADPFEFGKARVAISATVGGLEVPFMADEPGKAIRYADMAYYEAKNRHRGEVYLLTEEVVSRVLETSAMVHQIREAVQRHEFYPVFQPKMSLPDETCAAAECLIRWRKEDGTMVPPGQFIPVAESADLIEGIGRFIFLEACAAVQEWKRDPVLAQVKLAVNISPKQLERGNFVDFVKRSLATFDIPPSSLEFEITETTLTLNPKVAFAAIAALQNMGISIAIDDFGTGNSSLGMLRDVMASRAKVDRSFLIGVPYDEKSNRLLNNIVNLMRDMDLQVTVEGIETSEVAEYVKSLPCAEAQGFFYSRPLEKSAFEDFVRSKANYTSLNSGNSSNFII